MCSQAKEQLASLADAQQKLKFASASYAEADGKPVAQIGEFKNITKDAKALEKFGLKPDDLTIPDTGFQAAVFENNGKVIVSFKGTDFSKMSDIKADYEQALDMRTNGAPNGYYVRAQEISKKIAVQQLNNPVPPITSEFVGHSLGGGLASAAAAATGAPATTFNAAGLNPNTVTGGMSKGPVKAVNVKGEFLTGLVNKVPGLPDIHSTEVMTIDPPPSFGRDVVLPALGGLVGAIFGPLASVSLAVLARAGMLHTTGAITESLDAAVAKAEKAKATYC
jgi:type VI secretion system secreted protein VgrG